MAGLKRTNSPNRSISIKPKWQPIMDFANDYVDQCREGERSDNIKSFTDLVMKAIAHYLAYTVGMSKAKMYYENM